MKYSRFNPVVAAAISFSAQLAVAHVPYLETGDFGLSNPFVTTDASQSIAVYSWLESAEDVDFYFVSVTEPTEFFVELLVPVCPEYDSFFPQFALLGPSLPARSIPLGLGEYRLVVAPWTDRDEPRDTFFEPFGGKWYYEGPGYNQFVTQPGLYILMVWDPEGESGDYVLGLGTEERFPLPDLIRSRINTPIIRRNGELHSPCGADRRAW